MLREFEDEEENIIFNDENKIMSMSQEEFKEYLDSLDIKFTSEYGLNTTIQNPYLYDVFTIICSNGNEQLYEWLKEFRDHNNFTARSILNETIIYNYYMFINYFFSNCIKNLICFLLFVCLLYKSIENVP